LYINDKCLIRVFWFPSFWYICKTLPWSITCTRFSWSYSSCFFCIFISHTCVKCCTEAFYLAHSKILEGRVLQNSKHPHPLNLPLNNLQIESSNLQLLGRFIQGEVRQKKLEKSVCKLLIQHKAYKCLYLWSSWEYWHKKIFLNSSSFGDHSKFKDHGKCKFTEIPKASCFKICNYFIHCALCILLY